ncbi:Transcriptional regulator, TrmB [metagenome]
MMEFRKADQKRKQIRTIIEENHGYSYCDVQKQSGLVNGILSHHIKILEKNKQIRIRRENRKTWFFPFESDPENDFLLIYSKKERYRKVIKLLIEKNQLDFQEIQQSIGKSPSTTSLTLSNLIQRHIIKKTNDFKKKYELCDYNKTLELLSNTELTTGDKLKDRFADTFSYF